MPTLAQAKQHQRNLAELTRLAKTDLRALLGRKFDSAEEGRDALLTVLPQLTLIYGEAAATLAADWYDELRRTAGAKGHYRALPAEPPNRERVDATARWAAGPMFTPEVATDEGRPARQAAAIALAAGGLQRLIANMSRETVVESAQQDPEITGYARHASANACAFCAMLATRTDYTSERSAQYVVGRGSPLSMNHQLRSWQNPAQGIKSRGKRPLGEKYHDDCHCVAVPIWSDGFEPAPYVAEWRDAYDKAFGQLKTGTENYTPELLSNMRQILGTH